jgi:hypothetical protein
MMRSFKLSEAVEIIPEDLEDLLVRGAYLEHSAQELKRMHQEQTARLEMVRATQPPFMFLRPKDTREAYKEATLGTVHDLATIEKALLVNAKLSAYLRKVSNDRLEKWMRDNCVEYRVGLAAEHYAVDWEQALDRFIEHAKTFVRVLGSARNTAPAGYNHVKNTFSPAAYDAMKLAHTVALRVEAEIRATNAIAEEHDRMLGKTVFNDPMPRLVQEPYAAVVGQISGLAPTAAQAEFTRVIDATDDLIDRELDALISRVRNSGRELLGRTQGYVDDAWSQLHAHAVAHSVDRTQIEAVVAQTERLYTSDMQLMTA